MFENLIEILKANPRKIVYTEGHDARILESAARLKKGGFLTPVLVGKVDVVKAAAEKGGFDIEGLEILDPATYDKMDEMVETMVALRKGKMTAEECREALSKGADMNALFAIPVREKIGRAKMADAKTFEADYDAIAAEMKQEIADVVAGGEEE